MKVTRAVTDEGTVYCGAQQREIDVMSCYACEHLVDIDLDSRRPRIVCSAGAVAPAASSA